MSQKLEATAVELVWFYTPVDFFEESVTWDRDDYQVELKDGRVTARMTTAVFEAQPDFRARLDQELRSYFQGTALMRWKTFELNKEHITRTLPDGSKSITVELSSTALGMASSLTADPQGVINDIRRKRIDETTRLAGLAARVAATDPTARKLLECCIDALRNPDVELVRLYDIWEGIVDAFGGRGASKATRAAKARKALNIHERRFSQLANEKPLKQGRHRGRHLHNLRDASQQELDEARSIARDMLGRYLEYIESQQ